MKTTSFAEKGFPSLNRTPSRSLYVYVRPSALTFGSAAASAGFSSMSASWVSSPSKILELPSLP